jgi:predicted HicB family RNase H-like nuclease
LMDDRAEPLLLEISSDLMGKAEAAACELGISVNTFIEQAVTERLKQSESDRPKRRPM